MDTESIETFGSPLLADVQFNADGSLKTTGKQNVRFYKKKRLNFRGKTDENGKPVIDPKTGIPFKGAFEEEVEMVRVETKGDTNIKDDIADEFSKRQFYRQYKFFREGKIPDGNPIEDFPDIFQPNTITELHMHGIHVIQQAALMDDVTCERIKDQSGFELRDVAAQWVKINSPQGQNLKVSRLESEVQELKRKLEAKNGAPANRVVEAIPQEPEEEIQILEIPQSELGKGRKIKRKV